MIEGRTQQLSYLSFSSLSTSLAGHSWLSQPFLTPLQSDCIFLSMGLGLHFAKKRHGVFKEDCLEQDSLLETQFLFYPNPVHSTAILSVLSQGAVHHNIQLQLVDALGRTVKVQRLTWEDLRVGLSIDMSPFSSGIYFLRINSSGVNRVIKIIKI